MWRCRGEALVKVASIVLFLRAAVAAADLGPALPPYLGGTHQELGWTLTGTVVRIEDPYYVVRMANGQEFQIHVDASTVKTGPFTQGDEIEGRVDNQDHALSIRPIGDRSLGAESPTPQQGTSR